MQFIWIIAKKELTSNILSLRLLVGLVICTLLFASSAYVLTRDYEKRLKIYNASETRAREEIKKVKVYSELNVNIDKVPEPLSPICTGMEKQLKGTTMVSYAIVPTGVSLSGSNPVFQFWTSIEESPLVSGNPLLNAFSALDPIIIVQIVLSLFTTLVAYDTISGERERGTLKLLTSNPVSRFHVLIGKYLGGMGSILLPLTIGWIAGIAILFSSPMIEFSFAEWIRLVLLFLVSVLYLSILFLLSMLVSARTARSATALIWLLFLWVVMALVVPNGAAYLAGQVQPIDSKVKVDALINAMMDEFWKKVRDYGEKHPNRGYIITDCAVYSGMYPFAFNVLSGTKEAMLWYLDGTKFFVPLRIEYAERIGSIYEEYYRSLRKQTTLAGNLSRISPAYIYYNTSAILAGTDIGRYEHYIIRAQNYRRELMEYMRSMGAFSTIKYFSRANFDELPSQEEVQAVRLRVRKEYNMDDLEKRYNRDLTDDEKKHFWQGAKAVDEAMRMKPGSWDEAGPLNLSDMPVFSFGKENAVSAISRALPDLVILILLNILLFLGAAAVFIRSEVR